MPKATNSSTPKKFEMLKTQKQPSTTKFLMGKSFNSPEPKKFEMLGNKAAGHQTGYYKTEEMKTCL